MQGRSHRTREDAQRELSDPPGARVGRVAAADPFLELQASAGNAAVAGLIQGQLRGGVTVQGLWDTDDENAPDDDGADGPARADTPDGRPAPEDGSSGRPDEPADGRDTDPFPSVESEVTTVLEPGGVIDGLAPLATPDSQVGDFESPSGVTAQTMPIQRDNTPAEAPPTREGNAGDLIKAFKPFLEPALKFLQDNVLDALRRIKAGEAVVTVIVAAPILIGPLTQPGPRKLALDQLDGTDITFGVIPNLQLKPQISDGQLKGGTLTYDLAPALRKAGIPF
jgi:hypothetical protein